MSEEEVLFIKIAKIGKVLTQSHKDFTSKARAIIINNAHKLHERHNLVQTQLNLE